MAWEAGGVYKAWEQTKWGVLVGSPVRKLWISSKGQFLEGEIVQNHYVNNLSWGWRGEGGCKGV